MRDLIILYMFFRTYLDDLLTALFELKLRDFPGCVCSVFVCVCVFRLLSTKLQPPGGTIVTAPSGCADKSLTV